MLLIYNTLQGLLLPLVAPPVFIYLEFKHKYRGHVSARLKLPHDIPGPKGYGPRIWIHALSVGEVNAAATLVRAVSKKWPRADIICSSSTKTGMAALRRSMAGMDGLVIQMPFDLMPLIRKLVNRLAPDCFVLIETDVWPNLIWTLKKKGVPVLMVNGSISSGAQKKLKRLGKTFAAFLYNGLDHLAMQSEDDRRRLLDLGLPKDKVSVAGNLKYDIKCAPDQEQDKKKKELGLKPDGPVIVAGSTHKGEEAPMLAAFLSLSRDLPGLQLVIAPRDPDRGKEIWRMAEGLGLTVKLRSAMDRAADAQILVLDTLGELAGCYKIADIAFVGGSLMDAGGHNILEPAACGVPVIFGPHMESFRDVADRFVSAGAGIAVGNAKEMERAIRRLLLDKDMRIRMGKLAKDLIKKDGGATLRCLKLISDAIQERNPA
ncbi:MAG: 3-deoxy-D-manno-octulosonic acid transferase [Desulfobacteraceae bacterium]|nr:3-deoxy-D-manno-octulosonic acid transferase [Desulfobacteraceae bacterium]